MDIQKDEAFELAFLKTNFYKGMVESLKNKECPFESVFEIRNGKYRSSYVQLSHEIWQAAKAQAVPQWISTSERMPEEGEEVLVHSLGQVRQVTRDSKWAGGFKERNCYGWQAAYGQSHWMPKSIELPEQYHFYYENDAKQKAMIEAQEPAND